MLNYFYNVFKYLFLQNTSNNLDNIDKTNEDYTSVDFGYNMFPFV